ncbi:MAG: hypothetical protein WBM43_11155 [Flavobacteriaceae bacterium]
MRLLICVVSSGEGMRFIINKKGGEVSTFFAPNLTMNLTYLCYGKSKVNGFGRT